MGMPHGIMGTDTGSSPLLPFKFFKAKVTFSNCQELPRVVISYTKKEERARERKAAVIK